jgi:cytochrome c biogenesis protein CcdA
MWKELIGDVLLIAFGLILIFIFVTIELLGIFGTEPNRFIRWFEMIMGIPLIVLGIERFIKDVKK